MQKTLILVIIAGNLTITGATATFANSTNILSKQNAIVASWKPSKSVYAESAEYSDVSLDNLVRAIAVAEGASDTDQVGDSGKAAGRYQLHEVAVRHVNEKFHTNYVWPQDALNPVTARKIVKLYLGILGYNKKPLEMVIRKYNGGYKYWKSDAAGKYYEKIIKVLSGL